MNFHYGQKMTGEGAQAHPHGLMKDASLATDSVKAENKILHHTPFSNCMEFRIFNPTCLYNILLIFSFS